MSTRRTGSFSQARKWSLYTIGGGVWLSGGMWLMFHYFLEQQGEFGPRINPWEPWWLKIHGAFAFAAIWLFGLLWGVHITKSWPSGRRRWSGLALTSVFALLILTGYLLYYVGDEKSRSVLSLLHWTIGLSALVFFLWHRLLVRRRGSRPYNHLPAFRRRRVISELDKRSG